MATFFLVTPTNVGHETLGDIEKIIQAKVDPMAQLTHVTRKTGAMGTTPILMSRTNPDGIPLEDIIDQLIAEMNEKQEYIEKDKSLAAQSLKLNSRQIIDLLIRIKRINNESRNLLETISPDQGPVGKPRVGS